MNPSGTIHLDTPRGPLRVAVYGHGSPVLLLHANPGCHHDFDAVIPHIAGAHTVLGLDWPGYGQTPPLNHPCPVSPMAYARQLEEAADALLPDPAVVIGNSLGGYAAIRLALARPGKVAALVLAAPGGFTRHTAWTRAFCRVKGQRFATRAIGNRLARRYLRVRNPWTAAILARTQSGARNSTVAATDAAMWRSFTHPDYDLRERARDITVPVLLVWGRKDPILPAHTDGANARASMPHATYIELDCGHMPYAELPDQFTAAVDEFLRAVDTPQDPQ